ncbi:hypothetical protein ACIBI9_48970 [Nonomuraea sp. NPDC050451]|uniref:hypothetical protein n=1 Tax=Nonomuraea sp. NPDC050451 TaxID=3364364 RepID=UPI0037B199A2
MSPASGLMAAILIGTIGIAAIHEPDTEPAEPETGSMTLALALLSARGREAVTVRT